MQPMACDGRVSTSLLAWPSSWSYMPPAGIGPTLCWEHVSRLALMRARARQMCCVDTLWQVLAHNIVTSGAVGQAFVVQVCSASHRK